MEMLICSGSLYIHDPTMLPFPLPLDGVNDPSMSYG